jgi:hypothetical protein
MMIAPAIIPIDSTNGGLLGPLRKIRRHNWKKDAENLVVKVIQPKFAPEKRKMYTRRLLNRPKGGE